MSPSSRFRFVAGCLLLTAASARAQDSVSKSGCLPGDAVSPWADAAAPHGSEQKNTYVVDLSPHGSSWGTPFAVGPIVKAGKTSTLFYNALMNAQSISRRIVRGVPYASGSYALWNQAGAGINNDATLNDAPTSSVATAGKKSVQFATTFGELDTTDQTAQYRGIVTAIVNVDPENPLRLHVTRIQTAVNGCSDSFDQAAIGMGAVDANGNTIARADGFGVSNAGCLLSLVTGNNVYLFDAAARNASVLNVVSDNFPGGMFDAAATKWVIRNSTTSFNTPNLMPEEVTGGAPLFLGSDFVNHFVRGADFGLTVSDSSHFTAPTVDHRGNVSYLSRNFAPLASTHGVCGLIGRNASTDTDRLLVWGLNASANVTGTRALVMPSVITDNATGFVNQGPGPNEFDHYHSQVAFDGGNGQVALNVDAAGNLLAAAEVSQPTEGSLTNGDNYIAVCRVTPSGTESWTMAGYNDGVASGKPILDSLHGNPIGFMVPINKVTSILGPSMSAPMIDGAGNVWFLSGVEMFDGSNPRVALLRAVYDAAAFSYDLELVLGLDQVFTGMNSGRDYKLTDLRIADSNSVASATAWSQNITEDGFLGIDGALFDPADPRALGGIVLSAGIVYDRDGDGIFDPCTKNPFSIDESYRVLLYVGADATLGVTHYGQACPATGGFAPTIELDGLPKAGAPVTLTIAKALAGQTALLFFGLQPGATPMTGGCFLNVSPLLPLVITLPLFGPPGAGNGSVSFPTVVPTVAPGFQATMQAITTDPNFPRGYAASQGMQIVFQ